MKDIIILEKANGKKLSESLVDTTVFAKVTRTSSSIDLVWKYRWAMSNVDIDVAKKLRLIGVKKYWRRAG